jgi:endoglucanase
VKDVFDKSGAKNIKWVFSVNWENVPKENEYRSCYPGDGYVDYIGIDGYNWGDSAIWSKWRSFKEIFSQVYKDASLNYKKPVLITEFSSSASGGVKAKWIKQAFSEMRHMKNIKGFVIFLVNKEAAWGIEPGTNNAVEMKGQLINPHFIDTIRN